MGLGLNTTLMHGVVGIGYMANEASVQTSQIQYDNLPVALAKANVTNSIAYSLWLNDLGKTHLSPMVAKVELQAVAEGKGREINQLPQTRKWEAFCSAAWTSRNMLAI